MEIRMAKQSVGWLWISFAQLSCAWEEIQVQGPPSKAEQTRRDPWAPHLVLWTVPCICLILRDLRIFTYLHYLQLALGLPPAGWSSLCPRLSQCIPQLLLIGQLLQPQLPWSPCWTLISLSMSCIEGAQNQTLYLATVSRVWTRVG